MKKDIAYHLGVEVGKVHSKTAIIVHSERYANFLKSYLLNVTKLGEHDQFVVYEGDYQGIAVCVAITGIGCLATTMVIHELKALGVENYIKFGSFGAILTDVDLGDMVVPVGAVRQEGTSLRYVTCEYPAVPSYDLTEHLTNSLKNGMGAYRTGIILTKDSYYSSSGIDDYDYWIRRGVLGIELECSAMFVIGRLRGVRCAGLLICNRTYEGIARMKSGEDSTWSESIDDQLFRGARTCLSVIDKI